MSEIGVSVAERKVQLEQLLGRRRFFDGLNMIVQHAIDKDAEAAFVVRRTASSRHLAQFVFSDPDELAQCREIIDLPDPDRLAMIHGSVNVHPIIYNPDESIREGLVLLAHSHPAQSWDRMDGALLPSAEDLDIFWDVSSVRPLAVMVIAAAIGDARRAFMYCRSVSQAHTPFYQQLESPYGLDRVMRTLESSGVNHAQVDFESWPVYSRSVKLAIPELAR